MNSKWFASQYLDDGRWGILAANSNDENDIIMVGVSGRLTKERAETICRAVNAHENLLAACQSALESLRAWNTMGFYGVDAKQQAELYEQSPEIQKLIAAITLGEKP